MVTKRYHREHSITLFGNVSLPRFYPKKRVLLNGLRPAVRSLKRSLKNEDAPPMRYGRDTSGRTERDERTPCRHPTAKALSAAFLQEIRKKASAPKGSPVQLRYGAIRETSHMEELDMSRLQRRLPVTRQQLDAPCHERSGGTWRGCRQRAVRRTK